MDTVTTVALQDMQIYMKPVCTWWGGGLYLLQILAVSNRYHNVLQQVTNAVLPQLSLCQELLQKTHSAYPVRRNTY